MSKGFNVNGYIWVQLSEAGQQFLTGPHAHEFKEVLGGFHQIQLWQWMALTGPLSYNGMPAVFTVDNEIHFVDPCGPMLSNFDQAFGKMFPDLQPLLEAAARDEHQAGEDRRARSVDFWKDVEKRRDAFFNRNRQ